jgi:hypothetical protein
MQHRRRDFPGAIHLVRVRGRPGESIFFPMDTLDRYPGNPREHSPNLQCWEYLVGRACDRHPALLHGYAWLPNEAIMLLQRFAQPVDVIMATVCGQYSRHLRKHGYAQRGQSPYSSRYESIVVTPGVLPYAVRHLYWQAISARLCSSPNEYPLCSYQLHYAKSVPFWFEQSNFIASLEQRGYVGRPGAERFLRKPESPHHCKQFASSSGRKSRIAGAPTDVAEALWRSEQPMSAPSLERVAHGVSALLREESDAPPLESVLGKALMTWYATRSGAATLGEMGRWFGCAPTTLRTDIESHRRKSPLLFCRTVEEFFSAHRREWRATASAQVISARNASRRYRKPSPTLDQCAPEDTLERIFLQGGASSI